MPGSPIARLQKSLPAALFGLVAGALLVATANVVPLVLLWGVGPTITGSILLVSSFSGVHYKPWKAVLALLLSVPAFLLALFVFAVTTSLAQAHGIHPSSLISDLGVDMLCGLAAAALTGCLEMELLSWLLSGYWSLRHALLLATAGLAVLGITYGMAELEKRLISLPANSAQLWLFFGPLFVVGGSLIVAIVDDQMRHTGKPLLEPALP